MLVDGPGLLYRAFFAIKGLSTRNGRATNAVFGFIRMLRQIEQANRTTHHAVAFEGGECTDRLARLPTYKANRPPMPAELRSQLDLVDEYLRRARIPRLRVEGREADDVIASLAAWAVPEASEVLVASDDKDLYQIVDERVSVLSVSKGVRLGPAEVAGKTGVPPALIVDWLALAGDQSDNVPGVPGIGTKTAARLLSQYGGLAAIYDRVAAVEPARIRAALAEHRPEVMRNVEVIRLRRDLDCGVTWPDLERRQEDPDALLPFFDELEFHSLAEPLRSRNLF